jgi:hypothetical protein
VREDNYQELDKNTVSADSIRPDLMNSIVDFQLKSVDEGKFGIASSNSLWGC